MKTLTLRGVDDELSTALKQAARQAQTSVNQLVLDQLRQDLGLKKQQRFSRIYHDLDELFGRWSEEEYLALEERIRAQRTIDEALWR